MVRGQFNVLDVDRSFQLSVGVDEFFFLCEKKHYHLRNYENTPLTDIVKKKLNIEIIIRSTIPKYDTIFLLKN